MPLYSDWRFLFPLLKEEGGHRRYYYYYNTSWFLARLDCCGCGSIFFSSCLPCKAFFLFKGTPLSCLYFGCVTTGPGEANPHDLCWSCRRARASERANEPGDFLLLRFDCHRFCGERLIRNCPYPPTNNRKRLVAQWKKSHLSCIYLQSDVLWFIIFLF